MKQGLYYYEVVICGLVHITSQESGYKEKF